MICIFIKESAVVDVQAVIRAMSQSAEVPEDSGRLRRPVITLSRTIGSGGDEIAAKVAEKLGIKCYSGEILDAIAKQGKVSKKLMMSLHEKDSKTGDAWLYSMLFGKRVLKDDYLHFLSVTIRRLYHMGGVICGRGGNLILAGRNVLRVRITGSAEICAKRIALQDQSSLAEAKKKVRDSNRSRGGFIWNMFGKRINDPLNFDLTINTDYFADFNQVAEIIVQALQSMGYDHKQSDPQKK